MACNGNIVEGELEISSADIALGKTVAGVVGSFNGESLNPWNLRDGVEANGSTGLMRANCRNVTGLYNKATYDGSPSPAGEVWDTIDDWNGSSVAALPAVNPWGDDRYLCKYDETPNSTWQLVQDFGANSIFRDMNTNLVWTRGNSTNSRDFDNDEGDDGGNDGALEYCDNLAYGGLSANSWRVPTQKEMMQAYIDGIMSLDNDHKSDGVNLGDLHGTFWTSTTQSDAAGNAYRTFLPNGFFSGSGKTSSYLVLCVSDSL
jgi:hypothetical protein